MRQAHLQDSLYLCMTTIRSLSQHLVTLFASLDFVDDIQEKSRINRNGSSCSSLCNCIYKCSCIRQSEKHEIFANIVSESSSSIDDQKLHLNCCSEINNDYFETKSNDNPCDCFQINKDINSHTTQCNCNPFKFNMVNMGPSFAYNNNIFCENKFTQTEMINVQNNIPPKKGEHYRETNKDNFDNIKTENNENTLEQHLQENEADMNDVFTQNYPTATKREESHLYNNILHDGNTLSENHSLLNKYKINILNYGDDNVKIYSLDPNNPFVISLRYPPQNIQNLIKENSSPAKKFDIGIQSEIIPKELYVTKGSQISKETEFNKENKYVDLKSVTAFQEPTTNATNLGLNMKNFVLDNDKKLISDIETLSKDKANVHNRPKQLNDTILKNDVVFPHISPQANLTKPKTLSDDQTLVKQNKDDLEKPEECSVIILKNDNKLIRNLSQLTSVISPEVLVVNDQKAENLTSILKTELENQRRLSNQLTDKLLNCLNNHVNRESFEKEEHVAFNIIDNKKANVDKVLEIGVKCENQLQDNKNQLKKIDKSEGKELNNDESIVVCSVDDGMKLNCKNSLNYEIKDEEDVKTVLNHSSIIFNNINDFSFDNYFDEHIDKCSTIREIGNEDIKDEIDLPTVAISTYTKYTVPFEGQTSDNDYFNSKLENNPTLNDADGFPSFRHNDGFLKSTENRESRPNVRFSDGNIEIKLRNSDIGNSLKNINDPDSQRLIKHISITVEYDKDKPDYPQEVTKEVSLKDNISEKEKDQKTNFCTNISDDKKNQLEEIQSSKYIKDDINGRISFHDVDTPLKSLSYTNHVNEIEDILDDKNSVNLLPDQQPKNSLEFEKHDKTQNQNDSRDIQVENEIKESVLNSDDAKVSSQCSIKSSSKSLSDQAKQSLINYVDDIAEINKDIEPTLSSRLPNKSRELSYRSSDVLAKYEKKMENRRSNESYKFSNRCSPHTENSPKILNKIKQAQKEITNSENSIKSLKSVSSSNVKINSVKNMSVDEKVNSDLKLEENSWYITNEETENSKINSRISLKSDKDIEIQKTNVDLTTSINKDMVKEMDFNVLKFSYEDKENHDSSIIYIDDLHNVALIQNVKISQEGFNDLDKKSSSQLNAKDNKLSISSKEQCFDDFENKQNDQFDKSINLQSVILDKVENRSDTNSIKSLKKHIESFFNYENMTGEMIQDINAGPSSEVVNNISSTKVKTYKLSVSPRQSLQYNKTLNQTNNPNVNTAKSLVPIISVIKNSTNSINSTEMNKNPLNNRNNMSLSKRNNKVVADASIAQPNPNLQLYSIETKLSEKEKQITAIPKNNDASLKYEKGSENSTDKNIKENNKNENFKEYIDEQSINEKHKNELTCNKHYKRNIKTCSSKNFKPHCYINSLYSNDKATNTDKAIEGLILVEGTAQNLEHFNSKGKEDLESLIESLKKTINEEKIEEILISLPSKNIELNEPISNSVKDKNINITGNERKLSYHTDPVISDTVNQSILFKHKRKYSFELADSLKKEKITPKNQDIEKVNNVNKKNAESFTFIKPNKKKYSTSSTETVDSDYLKTTDLWMSSDNLSVSFFVPVKHVSRLPKLSKHKLNDNCQETSRCDSSESFYSIDLQVLSPDISKIDKKDANEPIIRKSNNIYKGDEFLSYSLDNLTFQDKPGCYNKSEINFYPKQDHIKTTVINGSQDDSFQPNISYNKISSKIVECSPIKCRWNMKTINTSSTIDHKVACNAKCNHFSQSEKENSKYFSSLPLSNKIIKIVTPCVDIINVRNHSIKEEKNELCINVSIDISESYLTNSKSVITYSENDTKHKSVILEASPVKNIRNNINYKNEQENNASLWSNETDVRRSQISCFEFA